jgi:NAD dependent epimerase/dehydratase family.
MDISNQRILVIGGSGLVGKAICRSLLSHPEQQPAAITITGRSSSKIEKTLDELKALSATTEFSGITVIFFADVLLKTWDEKRSCLNAKHGNAILGTLSTRLIKRFLTNLIFTG